ncbi:MAG: membrane dipeptidase [Henriciella sp.]|nr:membrane dipeptidase [Henriciella sp.]
MAMHRFRQIALTGALAFSIGACQIGAPISELDVAEIHANAIVLDAHADIQIESTSPLYLGADGRSKVAPDKLLQGGFDAVVMSVAASPQARTPEGDALASAESAEKLAAALALADSMPATIALATSADEVRANTEAGLVSVLLGFQNAQALEGDVDRIDELYNAGVRVFGLTHLGHNDFADSSRPKFDGATGTYEATEEHGGLSALGIATVERIDTLGGLIDVSQMSKAATLQAIEVATLPVIASHSNAKTLSDVTRNLSDEEIDRIGETGGVIHIAAFSAYLVDLSDPELKAKIRDVRLAAGLPETYSYPYELYWELKDDAEKITFLTNMRALVGREDVSRMVDHIDYVVDRIGIDHVGIGTDFNHGGGVVGFEEADSALNVTAELVRRGYSADEINKIWGGNFLRVLEAASTR